MNEDKEQWMEDVFNSMKGSKRLQPSTDLFAKIENEISTSKVIPIFQWKYAAAAAIVIFVNITSVFYYTQNTEINTNDDAVAVVYNQPLLSTYQIY
jgi:hypothetical protein